MIAVLIAGGLSYAASASPDGLDSTALRGCQTVTVDGTEQLRGDCIAQDATDHAFSSSPLADYALRGAGGTNGVAGVIGVLVTLAVAVGAFWLIARSRRDRSTETPAPTGTAPGA